MSKHEREQSESPCQDIKENPMMIPWRACKDGECKCGFVFDKSGEIHVLTVHNSDSLGSDYYAADCAVTAEKQKDLIAFVVRACNSHGALVAALRGAIANLEHTQINPEAYQCEDDDPDYIAEKAVWKSDIERFRAALKEVQS